MKTLITKFWASRLLPALLLAALIACGGKKDGGAGNTEINAGDIPKISQAGGEGGAGDSKDSATGDTNDICSKDGDAYAKYGKLTLKQRDYVFEVAQKIGFDALYKSSPTSYTAADYAVMHNYFLQTDKFVYGKLTVEIERRMAMAQAMAMATAKDDGPFGIIGGDRIREIVGQRKDQSLYYDLNSMMTARRNLFNLYATVFGMQHNWYDSNELEGELVAATKDIKELLAANTKLSAFRRAEIERGMVYAAQGTVMKAEDKLYVVHAVYSVEKKDVMIELAPVSMQSLSYTTYKEYTKTDEMAAFKIMEEYTAKIEQIEKDFTATATNKAQIEMEYMNLVASKDLISALMGFEYRKERGVVEEGRFNRETSTLTARKVELEKQIAEMEAALKIAKETGKDAAEIADLNRKIDSLRVELKDVIDKLSAVENAPPAEAPAVEANGQDSTNTLSTERRGITKP